MSEIPSLPIWEILSLNGISLVVLTGYLASLLEDACVGAEEPDDLPPLADPYAEV